MVLNERPFGCHPPHPQSFTGMKQVQKSTHLQTHAAFHEKGSVTQRVEPRAMELRAMKNHS